MYQYDASKYDASFRYPNFYQKKKKQKQSYRRKYVLDAILPRN